MTAPTQLCLGHRRLVALASIGLAVAGVLTQRLVTSAALILAISFLSLSTNPDAYAPLLVPALVALMGGCNWWMPAGLQRLLRVPAGAGARDPVRA